MFSGHTVHPQFELGHMEETWELVPLASGLIDSCVSVSLGTLLLLLLLHVCSLLSQLWLFLCFSADSSSHAVGNLTFIAFL